MFSHKPVTLQPHGRFNLRSTLAALTLLQFLTAVSLAANSPASNTSYQQLMGERNARITQLKQSNGDVFKQLLEAQTSDRARLKKGSGAAVQRREQEARINQHYSKLITELGVYKKEVETRIYGIWKASSTQLQSGSAPDATRWDAMDDVLGDFEESFLSSVSAQGELDPAQKILAEHLRNCSVLEQQFVHPFTGDSLTRRVKGFSGENCHYVEELPANGRWECFYPKDKLPQMADFYLHPERFENAEIKSRTEFVDGNLVTTTEYIVDGEAIFHPMNDSIEKGECKVLGYN